jgi:hypothetical protein
VDRDQFLGEVRVGSDPFLDCSGSAENGLHFFYGLFEQTTGIPGFWIKNPLVGLGRVILEGEVWVLFQERALLVHLRSRKIEINLRALPYLPELATLEPALFFHQNAVEFLDQRNVKLVLDPDLLAVGDVLLEGLVEFFEGLVLRKESAFVPKR